MRREERRLQQQQLRKNKRDEAIDKKRKLGGLIKSPPFLTCFVALNEFIDINSALSITETCEEDAVVEKSNPNITYLRSCRLKQRFTFVKATHGNELKALDYLKVCDSTVLLISAAAGEDIIDKWGEKFLTFALAQGIPTPIIVLMDLESISPKKRTQFKNDAQKLMNRYFPDEKLMTLDKTSDGLNLLRRIGGQKRNRILNKENRSHLYAEKTEYVNGTLKVTGYLRGIPFNVNGLVYIPELGTYQVSQIDSSIDPMSTNTSEENNNVLAVANPSLQVSLDSENIPDEMDAEQAFPSEEEIAHSMLENKEKKLIKRIPKGMSDYQACWIPDIEEVDEDEEDEGEDEDMDDSKSFMSCDSNVSLPNKAKNEMEEDSEEEYEDVMTEQDSIAMNENRYDEQMDLYEERTTQEKLKAERTDAIFPDEIDTPADIPARTRFQKYRGLESFRTSPWDVKENLPYDYARIFQFKDFDRIKRKIIKEAEVSDGEAMPGMYVTIYVANVSRENWKNYQSSRGTDTLILYQILPHENKMSLMNVVLKRTPSSTIPIKSKERLIFQCGYRRFVANPIFSQHTNGNKHKFERFFQPNSTVVASIFAPIQFPPAPVLCFRENPNGSCTLIANGSLLSCNPDRVVLKRVVLSGHPFKIHRRTATIRFMFHNKDDVNYFKPCKLRTKCGRVGHIRESLGTHGHMKCIFDGQLKSYDTIFLHLYKRIFPKWTYEEYKKSSNVASSADKME